MMKIAFLFGGMSRGGAERVIAHLSNSFVQMGDEVAIITMDNLESGYVLDERVRHIRLDLAEKSGNMLQSLAHVFKRSKALRQVVNENGFDAVVSFQPWFALMLLFAQPFGRKYRIIASERANPRIKTRSPLKRLLIRALINRVDGFIFQTKAVSECYSRKLREKGVVIPNGVFKNALPKEIVPFEKRQMQRIVMVGRLSAQKAYDVAIDAFARVKKICPEKELHIYGDGPLKDEIQKQCESCGVQDSVFFHGSVENVLTEIQGAGMFVLASRFEGMPNALMEAMACGLPCVATDCEFGPSELITHGKNGFLVPVEDGEKLAMAILQLSKDQEKARTMALKAADIRQSHNGERIKDMYHTYIQTVVAGKSIIEEELA